MEVNHLQLGTLVCLFIGFLAVPWLTKKLGRSLDSLPIRFAFLIMLIAVLPYDRIVALGVFLLVAAIYVQHHQNDLMNIAGTSVSLNDIRSHAVENALDEGGHSSETADTMDFIPNGEEQDNKFEAEGHSIDEKHALLTEPLGSKSQSLFAEDSHNADMMQRGNSNGHHD